MQGTTGPLPPELHRSSARPPSPRWSTVQGRTCLGRRRRKEEINTGRNAVGGRAADGCPPAWSPESECLGGPSGEGGSQVLPRGRWRPGPSTRRPYYGPHTSEPFVGPALLRPPAQPWAPQHPSPSTLPHLKPPAPRWAPPCGSCPWLRGDAEPLAPRRPDRTTPSAAPAAPSLSRHPQRPRAPPWSRPRRKCGGGGRGRHVERGRRLREPRQSTRFITGGSTLRFSPKATWRASPYSLGESR